MTLLQYDSPRVPDQWTAARETSEIVAAAIHAISDETRSPEAIWEAPTDAEADHVRLAVEQYHAAGLYDSDPDCVGYPWGQETVSLALTDILVQPLHEGGPGTGPATELVMTRASGTTDEATAIALLREAGYAVVLEGDGGHIASYDAEDAHGTIGATEGHSGICVTVEPEAASNSALTLTVYEPGQDSGWTVETTPEIAGQPARLAAVLAAELAHIHPTTCDQEWEVGLALPTLGRVHVEDAHGEAYDCPDTEIPVGVGKAEVRQPDAAGHLIHSCDEHGQPTSIAAWYEHPPSDEDVRIHTGQYGGIVERLTDGHWNWGGGWRETVADAIAAVDAAQ